MNHGINLKTLLSPSWGTPSERLALFAWLNLGLLESLAHGFVSTTDAVQLFFNAENCLFVRKRLRDKAADEVMSRGVQLPDLFESLPTAEAQREFQRELATMRSLCLNLLGRHAIRRLTQRRGAKGAGRASAARSLTKHVGVAKR